MHGHRVATIVIGRNEGERLKRCLRSVLGQSDTVVYVDSGSDDGSVAFARSLAASVVELDRSIPFTAARARNAGFARARDLCGARAEYAFFVDGDCEVAAGWVDRAAAELDARRDVAVVCGRLRERDPAASVYNRLCQLEWDAPTGEVESSGGIFVVRAGAFADAGGFAPDVAAGEEPELCLRLRTAGWKILRLPDEMAAHDAAMLRLGQWWRRSIRGAYWQAKLSRQSRGKLFARDARSALVWTAGWATALAVVAIIGFVKLGTAGALIGAATVAAALPAQALRLAIRVRGRTPDLGTALAYGSLTVLGKWAQFYGQLLCWRDAALGRTAQSIEYKRATSPGTSAPAPAAAHASTAESPWRADLKRYPRRPWFKEQSIWPIAVYRFGRWNDARRPGPTRWLFNKAYWVAYRVVETLTGISFLKCVDIGPGLRIWHFGNVFINPASRLGANCTLRHGVTIGNRFDGGPAPVIEDDVEFGCYAQVLGGVHVGRGAKIGAMSLVLCDVPAGATAVGVPARIILPKTPAHQPQPPRRAGAAELNIDLGDEQPDVPLGYPMLPAEVLSEIAQKVEAVR